jgi:putative transposase
VVARVLQVNRSGLYRTPKRRPKAVRRALIDPVDRLIVEVARANPTDGTRMVAALTSRELGCQVNRKRAQRVMREQRLLQRHRPLRVSRPALAPRHDEYLGRGARLVLLERGDRLLHA